MVQKKNKQIKVHKIGTFNSFKKQGERARVMQMKNQRFLYPESAAERRQAEDDPLVRSHGVDGGVDGDGDGDGDTL